MNLKIEYVPIDQLEPYEGNAKLHPAEQIEQIKKSIQDYGFRDPVGVWHGTIVEGHGRILAAKELGLTEVPVINLDDLTDEQRREYALIHNQTTMNSGFDFAALDEEFANLPDFDAEFYGFELPQIVDDAETVEDDVSEDVETRCKLGDLWQLGNHRLICGDSTESSVVETLMDGAKADMVMTDPPYGINAEKMTMGAGAKEFYRGNGWDLERPNMSLALSLSDNVCIWGGNYFADVLPVSNDWLVWHKKNDGRSFSECELAWTNFGRNIRHISHHWGSEKKLHVTMKPVYVIAWAIQQGKENAKNIVDLFGGSGTTLIACEQLSRKCYTAELDPHYCDVIIKRWEDFTGKKAVLLNGK